MKILIIEDAQVNIKSAQEFATSVQGEHEVTILASADAIKKDIASMSIIPSVEDTYEGIGRFDMVMTDLLLPTSMVQVRPGEYGAEQPYGLVVLLLALKHQVRFVGLLSDGSHHNHPILMSMDMIRDKDRSACTQFGASKVFIATDSIFIMFNENIEVGLPGNRTKDWSLLFNKLTT